MGIKINICQCFVDAEGATWAISRVVQGQCMDTTATKQYFFGGKVQLRTRDIEPSQVFWSKVTQQKGPTDYICNQFWIQLYINANLYARYIKIQYVCVCVEWVCSIFCESVVPSSLESFKCHHPKCCEARYESPFYGQYGEASLWAKAARSWLRFRVSGCHPI